MSRIEDYAPDRRPADGGPGGPGRLDRLAAACRGSTPAPASPRCSAAPTTAAGSWRPSTDPAPAGATARTRWCWSGGRDGRRRVRHRRFHAAARRRRPHRPHRGGPRRRGADALGADHPLRLRRAISVGRRATTRCARRRARTRSAAHAGADARRGMRRVAEFTLAAGRAGAVRPDLASVAPADRRADRRRGRARRRPRALAGVVGTMHATGRVARGGAAVGDYAQGADLRAHRRHRRGADHLAAGVIGGERNWDYRFCWLRDAALTCWRCSTPGTRRGGGVSRVAAPRRRRRPGRRGSCTASPASVG